MALIQIDVDYTLLKENKTAKNDLFNCNYTQYICITTASSGVELLISMSHALNPATKNRLRIDRHLGKCDGHQKAIPHCCHDFKKSSFKDQKVCFS